VSIFTIETYLAAGFSKKEVLDALVGLDNELINQVLASHPYTTAQQLASLSRRASMDVAVLTASRRDLPAELVEQIIRSGKPLPRQALLQRWSTHQQPGLKISDELITYLLAQSWFSALYAASLLECMPEDSKLRAAVQEVAQDYVLVTKANAYKRNASRISGIRYKSPYLIYKSEFSQEHKLSDKYLQRLIDLKSDDLAAALNGRLSVFDYGDPIRISPPRFAPKVEGLLAAASAEVITLFFQMLPSWKGTLRELIDTVSSLSGTTTSQKAS